MSNTSLANQVKRRSSNTVQKLEDLHSEIKQLIEAAERATAALSDAKQKLSLASYPGLNFTFIRDTLSNLYKQSSQDWIPTVLSTSGKGPWDEHEFDAFLQGHDIQLFQMPDQEVNGLVLGTSEWDVDSLVEQVYGRSSSSLRIYTQELFVLGLITGRDPFEFLEQNTIDEIALNHPAIQFIVSQEFTWPWSDQQVEDDSSGEWEFDAGEWANESVLRQLGYNASANGPDDSERRRILRIAFESEKLPGLSTPDQRARWGSKQSSRRLHAISHFLGWLINLQGSEKPSAQKKWIADLKWLKQNFYAKTMSFSWPTATSAPITKTMLNPQASWPFAEISAERENSGRTTNRTPLPTALKLLTPRHQLAIIIGPKPRPSVAIAVEELRDYIRQRQLVKPGSTLIEADSLLFSLSGQRYIKDSDLQDLVDKNMTS